LATARDSKPITMSSMSTNGMAGTMRWQAPELLNPDPNEGNGASSMASDVYAFACVCYEVKSMVS
jgi:serine/threonine protein kinase